MSEPMKILKWIIGASVLAAAIGFILWKPIPFLFHHDLPHVAFFGRALYILLLAAALCLYRVARGPTAADRMVAVEIMGVLIVGLCAVLSVATGRSWYVDIGIAWALQSFISTLAFSKYLEGRGFDE